MKVVAVTGGGQGIGRAIAYRFAAAGYAVSLADPDAAAGREVVAEIEKRGGMALFVRTDVAREADVKRWLGRTLTQLDCPEVLVNNAGLGKPAPFLALKPKDFDRVIAVNLRGTFLCAQEVARHMVRRGRGGSIINISSTRAFMSEKGTEAYTASKGGIVALTHGMAISLGPEKIRVNCIAPGWIETADWKKSSVARAPKHSIADRRQHPVGRVGRPDDIAEACLFLASAGFITGQTMIIDGGMTVKMIYD